MWARTSTFIGFAIIVIASAFSLSFPPCPVPFIFQTLSPSTKLHSHDAFSYMPFMMNSHALEFPRLLLGVVERSGKQGVPQVSAPVKYRTSLCRLAGQQVFHPCIHHPNRPALQIFPPCLSLFKAGYVTRVSKTRCGFN